jgi:hypothetical protein
MTDGDRTRDLPKPTNLVRLFQYIPVCPDVSVESAHLQVFCRITDGALSATYQPVSARL